MVYHFDGKILQGLFFCSMSLVLTFIFATSHVKTSTSSGTLDFQMKFVGRKKLRLLEVKNKLTKNKPKDSKTKPS